MSKHLNDLSAVYMASIAEETVCPVCGFDPCQCLEGTLDESCGCDHEGPKNKMQVGQEKAKEKYSGKKLRDLPGRKKVEEDKKPIHIGRMLSQASNKDYAASKEENPSKREKLETQARTIRTTVDMDSFRKRKSKIKPQRAGVQEGFSNWRTDLIEVIDNPYDTPSSQAQKDSEMKVEIKDKKVKNKVIINPPMGVSEAIEALGGTILEMMEYDDEFDYILGSVYEELLKEGFSEDEVEFGIESALTTLDEGYYDSATETSKSNSANVKTTQFTAKKKTQGSIKDRLKSAAKKAIVGAGRAAARAANTADAVKSAPGRAAKKVSSAVARVKGLAKSGYESERKSGETTYRGKGVGRKEKIGEDVEQVDEKLNLKKADMGDVVKDFYKSDAPQFKGKSKEKRRQMAVAAKLEAERGPQVKEGLKHRDVETGEVVDKAEVGKTYYTDGPRKKSSVAKAKSVKEARDPAKEAEGKKISSYEKTGRAFGLIKKFRQENPGSRQPKKVRGAKETEGQAAARRRGAQAQRAAKYGLTSKEKKETQARAKYDSPRD